MNKKLREQDYIKIKLSEIFLDDKKQLKKLISNDYDKPLIKKRK